MELVTDASLCVLESFGADVQLQNKTRKATCGLDPAFRKSLNPPRHEDDVEDGTKCITGFSSSIRLQYWTPCVDGAPRIRTELSFPEALPNNSYCSWVPHCKRGAFKSHIFCYLIENQEDDQVLSVLDTERNAAPQHLHIVLVLPFFLFLSLGSLCI